MTDNFYPYRYCCYCSYRVHISNAGTCQEDDRTLYFCKTAYKGTGRSCYELHQAWHSPEIRP